MSELAEKACVPCPGGVPPLSSQQIRVLLPQLDDGWAVVDQLHL